MKQLFIALLFVAILGGCVTIEDLAKGFEPFISNQSIENSITKSAETSIKICDLISSNDGANLYDIWRNQCKAFEDKNPELCKFFGEDYGGSEEAANECYYEISIFSDENACSMILPNQGKRWCNAIVQKNTSLCEYFGKYDAECVNRVAWYYLDKSICEESPDVINMERCLSWINRVLVWNQESKKDDIISQYESNCADYETEDCSVYEDPEDVTAMGWCAFCRAIRIEDPALCFGGARDRDKCLENIALSSEDISLCYELRSENRDECINNFAEIHDYSLCLNSECVLDSVRYRFYPRQKQDIPPEACENIKSKSLRRPCLFSYVRTELIRGRFIQLKPGNIIY